jgi:membrane protease YdiL (CAAX protease family)
MGRNRPLVTFFVLVFAVTWGLIGIALAAPGWVASLFGPMSMTNPLFIGAAYGPTVVSIALTAWLEGRPGLRVLLGRLNPLRTNAIWFLIVLIGYPVAVAIVAQVGRLFGGDGLHLSPIGPGLAGIAIGLVTVPGALGEELGWRGFALPRMLFRWSPFAATMILGSIWAIWHLPAFALSGVPFDNFALPAFLIGVIGLAVIFTWIFIGSNGSVLATILLHLMANQTNGFLGVSFATGTIAAIVLGLAIIGFGGLRRRSLPPTVIQPPSIEGRRERLAPA